MRPYLLYMIAAGSALGMSGGPPADWSAAWSDTAEQAAPAHAAATAANGERGPHAFYFTRAMYSDNRRGWGGGGRSWRTDFPKADIQFLIVLRRLTNLDAYEREHPVHLADPELRRFPFIYMLEVGSIGLTPEESDGLRGYMLAGGFVFIDDFWGDNEWRNFEEQMRRTLPEYPIVDLPRDHPILSSFYKIDEILQVPAVGRVRNPSECGPCQPTVRAMFDEEGRLMMMINWNTDIGDAWEWAEQPYYPTEYSTFAYQMGVNAIVYAMSH
ncbi:MAG: DUF4159 domain-containing protein [Gemmatimonadota bacterium]